MLNVGGRGLEALKNLSPSSSPSILRAIDRLHPHSGSLSNGNSHGNSATTSPSSSPMIRNSIHDSPLNLRRNFASKISLNKSDENIDVSNSNETKTHIKDFLSNEIKGEAPSIPQSSWTFNGKSNVFLSKDSEQYWRDLQNSRQEEANIMTYRAQNIINPSEHKWSSINDQASKDSEEDALQWLKDLKKKAPGKINTPERPIFHMNNHKNEETSSYSYSIPQIQIVSSNAPKRSNNDSTESSPSNSNPTSPTNPKFDIKSDKTAEKWLENSENHKKYLETLGKKLGISYLEDWYHVNILDVMKYKECSEMLRNFYGNSLIRCLMTLYPTYEWKISKFDYSYKGLLNDDPELDSEKGKDIENEEKAHSQEAPDFNTTFSKYKNHWQVRYFSPSNSNSLAHDAVGLTRSKVLPVSQLNEKSLHQDQNSINREYILEPSEGTKQLIDTVKNIFPDAEVKSTFYRQDLIYSDTKRPFSLSVFIPKLNLAFEYLEDPNFSWQYSFGAEFSSDTFYKSKKIVCDKLGITLIEVPSWWDKRTESLIEVIKRNRSDLLPQLQKKANISLSPSATPSPKPIHQHNRDSYFLTKRNKDASECKGCKTRFHDSNQFVIQSNQHLHQHDRQHHQQNNPLKSHYFCVNPNCIEKSSDSAVSVKISPEIKKESLPTVEGIQWTD